ncbi:MAG: GTPase Era [Thermosynechococcaceae cyanobacterium MS004]|nr:GTPase Era [Thermosynechococcaceae cyanobacterium MS004]
MIPESPPGFRSGFIALIGRPNVGKSTLMNQLIGQKVSITSPLAQTTRNRLRGILTRPDAQIIFVDTPGIHKPHHSLGEILVKNAIASINAVDLVLFVVDGSTPLGKGDQFIETILAKSKTPVILGVNKADLMPEDPQKRVAIENGYGAIAAANRWPIHTFSAVTEVGLDPLLTQLIQSLDLGPYYYPPDLITDQPERFIMGELIREQILALTREEVPHSVAITLDRVEEEDKITRILATVHVERPSQKAILIGKNGSMMKEIGTQARQQIQKLVMGKVYLELFVKVQANWRQSNLRLLELGYRVERD